MTKEDENLLVSLSLRPEVTKYIGPLSGIYKETCVKVIETTEGLPIGLVAIISSQAMDGSDHELICAILEDYERKDHATNACRLILEEVLNDSSMKRVIGCVDRKNASSLALIKKLGGEFLQQRGEMAPNIDIYSFNQNRCPTN